LLARKIHDLPFLAIESDGNRFPQIITAKLEAFLLQAERLHGHLQQSNAAIADQRDYSHIGACK